MLGNIIRDFSSKILNLSELQIAAEMNQFTGKVPNMLVFEM